MLAFDDHVRFHDLGDELDKEDDADDAEEVRNSVADRDEVFMGGTDRLFGGGKRRGRGEGAGQETCHQGFERLVVFAREPFSDEDDSDGHKDGGEDDDESQTDIGLVILFEVSEETGPGDEPDRGDEQDQSDILDDLQCLLREGDVADHQVRFEGRIEEAAVQQSGDEHAGGAEVDALDRDTSQQISGGRDQKDGERQIGDRLDGQQSQSSSHG